MANIRPPLWQRHDWHRFVRHDAHRFFTPAGLAEQKRAEEAEQAARRLADELAAVAEQEALADELCEMRTLVGHLKSYLTWRRAAERSAVWRPHADSALNRFNLAYARYFGEDNEDKAGFNPDQPRVPKGDPDGGRWAKEGGGDAGKEGEAAALQTENAALRRGGHHYVAQQVYRNRKLPEETRKVFEDGTTGKLEDRTTNVFSSSHRTYNKAVNEQFDRFLSRNNISEDQMTPDHARQFLNEIITSRDPRIRNFNMRIWMRELFRGGRFRGSE